MGGSFTPSMVNACDSLRLAIFHLIGLPWASHQALMYFQWM